VFIYGFLLMRRVRAEGGEVRSDAILSMIFQLMSSVVLSPKILSESVMINKERLCGSKRLLTIDAHSDGVKK
jgi:hypothetical protein